MMRGLPGLEGLEITGLVVGGALLPASKEDASPFECKGSEGRLVGRAALPLAPVEFASPIRARNRQCSPLDESLAKKSRRFESPVDPVLLAAAFGDRGHAAVALDLGRIVKTFAVLAKGSE